MEEKAMTDNIEVFTQSSIRIKTEDQVIYIDPFRLAIEPHDADLIFITHDHYDHFSVEDIQRAAKPSTILIVPEKMEDKACEAADPVSQIETVVPGESYEIAGLSFETVPAYNKLKPFHPKSAGWVGYILTAGEKRIYIAGDTDMTKDNQQVKCDIALVPIGGKYTMDAAKAAELINVIRPETAIPTHYGSIVGSWDDAEVFAGKVDPAIRVEVKIRPS